jgi:hypothetical protein
MEDRKVKGWERYLEKWVAISAPPSHPPCRRLSGLHGDLSEIRDRNLCRVTTVHTFGLSSPCENCAWLERFAK